jgi:hypothetical protein
MDYVTVVASTNKVIGQYDVRLTVRQIYYRLISPPFQLFANTLSNYKSFDKILTRAREKDEVDWRRIEDRSRTTIGGDGGFDSPEDFMDYVMRRVKGMWEGYSRPAWRDQSNYVEVWVEKDALATLVSNVADSYRVLTYPSRGYSSFTRVMEAIEDRFAEVEESREIFIIHLTDHDPSGLDMTRDVEDRIRQYWSDADRLTIERVALTFDQVKKFNLASNPTKIADPRSQNYHSQYGNQCWELDALPPDELEKIVKRAINGYIEADVWDANVEQINEEKKALEKKFSKMKLTFGEEEKPKKRKKGGE